MRRIDVLATALAAGLLAGQGGRAEAVAAPGYVLGVQTHFSQGWADPWRQTLKSTGARHVRDGLAWAKLEPRPGQYAFGPDTAGYLDWFRKQGIDVILTIEAKNPAYDGGRFVQSEAGRRAYAAYLNEILSRYGDVVYGVEVGNELNTGKGMPGVDAAAKPAAYAALLKTVYPMVKAKHPNVHIIGASTNVIGTGFIADVFRAGGGPYMDAVAVHPYRSTPEGVDGEIAHLEEVLRPLGGPKPILATEFGDSFPQASDAPAFMLKMTCLMSGRSGRIYWYTLQDEPWFKNQGLFDTARREKPAAEAFRLLQDELAAGPPVRIEAGDPRTFVYRLGANTFAIWGADRQISFAPGTKVRNAQGLAIAAPAAVSMTPILVSGRDSFRLGPPHVLADSLLDYGRPEWGYFAQTADGKLHALKMVDWIWTSYYGGAFFKPLRINVDSLAPAGGGDRAIAAVSRFTAPRAQKVRILASLKAGAKGDGVTLIVRQNDTILAQRQVHAESAQVAAEASLKSGDHVDFVVSPGADSTGDVVKQHFQVVAVSGEGGR